MKKYLLFFFVLVASCTVTKPTPTPVPKKTIWRVTAVDKDGKKGNSVIVVQTN